MPQLTVPVEATAPASHDRILAAIAKVRDLPAAVPIVQKALAQLDKPDFVVAELKNTLMSDQALAARILRLANSAYFGFRSEVQTVSQAVVLLGQKRISTLLRRILTDKIWLDLSRNQAGAAPLRKVSLAAAAASCCLSQLLLREDAEEMLLAGLLHNIGRLFLLSQFPAEYDRVPPQASSAGRAEAEAGVFGMPASRAGGLLLEKWNFPALYPAAVEHHENPLSKDCPSERAPAIALVHVGFRLAEAYAAGASCGEAVLCVSPEVCQTFQYEPDLLGEVYGSLPQRMSIEQLQAGRT